MTAGITWDVRAHGPVAARNTGGSRSRQGHRATPDVPVDGSDRWIQAKNRDPMSKPAGRCIFCGGGNLSKEHIFPDWLQQYVPRTEARTDHRLNRGIEPAFGRSDFEPGKLTNNGDLASRKLRVACEKCNNGWMSRLQMAAKPLLVPFIAGGWPPLSMEEARIIAAWATMFSMVFEWADPTTAVIPQQQRTKFSDQSDDMRAPPSSDWSVYIGHQRLFCTDVAHTGVLGAGTTAPLSVTRIAITTLGIGSLVLHTVMMRAPGLEVPPLYGKDLHLRLLWPYAGASSRPPVITNAMWLKILCQLRGEIVRLAR